MSMYQCFSTSLEDYIFSKVLKGGSTLSQRKKGDTNSIKNQEETSSQVLQILKG